MNMHITGVVIVVMDHRALGQGHTLLGRMSMVKVIMVMIMAVVLVVVMMVMVMAFLALDLEFPFGAAAYSTHYSSISRDFTFI